MGRKSVKKPSSKHRDRADDAELFPDVAPIAATKKTQPKKLKAKKTPSAPRTSSAPVASPTIAPPPFAAPRRTRFVVLGAVGVAFLGAAAFLGARFLLGSDSEHGPAERAALLAKATRAPEAGSPLAPSADASAAEPTAPAPSGVATPAASAQNAAPAAAAPNSLAQALKDLVAATASREEDAVDSLKESLSELAAQNPTAALGAVVDAMKAEKDPQALAALASVLLDDALAGRPEVLSALADMAQKDELPSRRATALRTLGDLPGGDAARVELIMGMEQKDQDPLVRASAASALGAVGERSPGPVAAAVAKSLIEAASAETDPQVRATLLYAVRDTRDASVADALLSALAHDTESGPRLAAAEMLGSVAAPHRARAMDVLAVQLGQESDARMRETIIKSIVSAGRMSAVPVLQRLRADSGEQQALIDDYLAGLASGEDSIDKLDAIKAARETARAH